MAGLGAGVQIPGIFPAAKALAAKAALLAESAADSAAAERAASCGLPRECGHHESIVALEVAGR
jgi:hypothetical protein